MATLYSITTYISNSYFRSFYTLLLLSSFENTLKPYIDTNDNVMMATQVKDLFSAQTEDNFLRAHKTRSWNFPTTHYWKQVQFYSMEIKKK